ncbi:hypothetical protein AGDE_04749 [Angomonas deanei]|nr:hypothetical protein AGDE_04749 [Angomonas deanei]|eukprot:EPY39180.1 hypothetical protein AGDE_04749 [Angomonas deanei]
MLVNSRRTDPDEAIPFIDKYLNDEVVIDEDSPNPYGEEQTLPKKEGVERIKPTAYNTSFSMPISPHVRHFALALQEQMGTCSISARNNRLDVIFQDRQVLQLALGADVADMGGVTCGKDINAEPEATRRNRLRISLGFDEDLFKQACAPQLHFSARSLEKWAYDRWLNPTHLDNQKEAERYFLAHDGDHKALLPPVTFWLAHLHAFIKTFDAQCSMQDVESTIRQVFYVYYGHQPFENPFCEGEDLNTINTVKWLCECYARPFDKDGGEPLVLSAEALPEEAVEEQKETKL